MFAAGRKRTLGVFIVRSVYTDRYSDCDNVQSLVQAPYVTYLWWGGGGYVAESGRSSANTSMICIPPAKRFSLYKLLRQSQNVLI